MFGQTPLSNLSLGRVGRDLVALILSSWDFSLSLLRQHNNFHFIRMFISASLFCMNLLSIPQQTRPRSRIEALWVTQPKPHITRVTFLSLFDPLQRRLNKESAELHILWMTQQVLTVHSLRVPHKKLGQCLAAVHLHTRTPPCSRRFLFVQDLFIKTFLLYLPRQYFPNS